MAYELSYAGVGFRINPPSVMEHLARFEHLLNLRDVVPLGQVWPGPKLLQLGAQVPPGYPPLEIGDFFYPVGASRWAQFRGIAAAPDVAAMQAIAYAKSNTHLRPQTFIIQSEGGDSVGSVSTQLFMLPPIPLTGGTAAPQLYLITLVDERYFWHQWQSGGQITCTALTTTGSWSGLLIALAAQLGITLNFAAVDIDYGMPEPDSPLYSNDESPAVLLDQVAANVGCAVIRTDYNVYSLQRWADAATQIAKQRPKNGNNVLGGQALSAKSPAVVAAVPSAVAVTFPVWISGQDYYQPEPYRDQFLKGASYGATFAVETNLTALPEPYAILPTFAGTKQIATTAKALFASVPPSGSPTNLTALQNLAKLLATDYIDSLLTRVDEVYAGVYPWGAEALNDLLYSWRSDQVYTRILPPRFNDGPSQFQHGLGPLAPVSQTDVDVLILGVGVYTYFQINAVSSGEIFTVGYRGYTPTVSYTAGGTDTPATVVTALLAALNASVDPVFVTFDWWDSATAGVIGSPTNVFVAAIGVTTALYMTSSVSQADVTVWPNVYTCNPQQINLPGGLYSPGYTPDSNLCSFVERNAQNVEPFTMVRSCLLGSLFGVSLYEGSAVSGPDNGSGAGQTQTWSWSASPPTTINQVLYDTTIYLNDLGTAIEPSTGYYVGATPVIQPVYAWFIPPLTVTFTIVNAGSLPFVVTLGANLATSPYDATPSAATWTAPVSPAVQEQFTVLALETRIATITIPALQIPSNVGGGNQGNMYAVFVSVGSAGNNLPWGATALTTVTVATGTTGGSTLAGLMPTRLGQTFNLTLPPSTSG